MKVLEYIVSGMRCSGCTSQIDNKVKKMVGVRSVNVNLLTGICRVEAEDDFLDTEVIKVINQLGFKAKLKKDGSNLLISDNYFKLYEMIIAILLSTLSLIIIFSNKLGSGNLIGNYLNYNSNPVIYSLVIFILTVPVIIIGLRFYIPGLRALFKLHPNMDSLISIGSLTAFIYSLVYFIITLVTKDSASAQRIMAESSVMIITLIYIGKYIEQQSKNKAKNSINDLLNVLPQFADVLRDEKIENVCVNMIQVNDIVIVRPGERVAVDGLINEGSAKVDSSAITGESKPKMLSVGDTILGGSIVLSGVIQVRASKISGDASINNILYLVSESNANKTKRAEIVDKISIYFVPIILTIAFITFFTWLILTKDFPRSMTMAISALVIACPCSIGLAIPLANVLSNSQGLKSGFVYKNSAIHEDMKNITKVFMDKTGTLTSSNLNIQEIDHSDIITDNSFLSIIMTLEYGSNHPLSKSIIKYAKSKDAKVLKVTNAKEIPSKGVYGEIEGAKYYFGNINLLQDIKVEGEMDSSYLYLVADTKVVGRVKMTDELSAGAHDLISYLESHNIKTCMLTGDTEEKAASVAKKLKITEYKSNLMPSDKYNIIKDAKLKGEKVMFIGDGVNDAPSISESDIGVSPYGSSDVACDSSDVYLLNNNLGNIIELFKISKYTDKIIKVNLVWAFLYNIIGVVLATGIFSFAGIILLPWMSALIMSLSSVCVVITSLTIKLT
ncbi:MAG: cation-translocating P-type ATPase [Bacilli bacterium]